MARSLAKIRPTCRGENADPIGEKAVGGGRFACPAARFPTYIITRQALRLPYNALLCLY